jgi:hypothetical protein
MPTMRTEQIGFPAAIGTRPGRLAALNVVMMWGAFSFAALAISDFLDAAYLRSFGSAAWGLAIGIHAGHLVAGRNFQEELAKHPGLRRIYLLLVFSGAAASLVNMREWK